MPEQELSQHRLRTLYATFRRHDPWPRWSETILAELQRVHGLSDDALASPAEQERLWRARALATIGPGEAVQTGGAYDDPEVVERVLRLRRHTWPTDPGRRAQALQEAYDELLELVHTRHSPQQPQAKLTRLFAVLLPGETTACLNYASQRNLVQLVLGARKVGTIEGSVLARARLRTILGDEADLAEHTQRWMFAWWLHEHAETILQGGEPPDPEPEPEAEPDAPVERLTLQPPSRQLKGLVAVTGYLDTWRAAVRAAEGGASADDIVDSLRAELPDLSARSCRTVYNSVRRFRFLHHRDGLWYPSEDGLELVSTDPADILVKRFLVETFGLAHLLRHLGEGARPRTELFEHLQTVYPSWTTGYVPSAILAWARALGLVDEAPGNTYALSAYGREWERRLPDDLAAPEVLNDASDPEADAPPPRPWPTDAALLQAFASDDQLRGFVFPERTVRTIHHAYTAQPRKRFVILSGLSGTGKTALLVHYARVFCALLDLDPKAHTAVVPVSPDWRDPSGLLGYLNALHAEPSFHAEPALRGGRGAPPNPPHPHHHHHHQMNLARVERYFAPFLSAMETGDQLVLHAHEEPIHGVPPTVPWPSNLFIGGTVNMDETTHAFSDKVLDRAFTLEFFDVELPTFLERRAATHPRLARAEKVLLGLHDALRPIRRHFGYRTAHELLLFVQSAAPAGDEGTARAMLDQAVFSKVLPRLRGEQTPALSQALEAARAVCAAEGLSECVAKLEEMEERLLHTGMTRFWS